MAESKAYLIAAAQGPVQSLSSTPHIELVRPVLDNLMRSSGIPAKLVQEIHWFGGEDEYWLGGLGEPHGFQKDLVRFFWPVTPLLAHTLLQFTARAIEAGDRDLVLLAQETGGQAVALLLASQQAADRHNLTPRAVVGKKLALSSIPDGLMAAARAGLERAGQNMQNLSLLAAARRINAAGDPFPGAQWINPGPDLPSGDLFLMAALVRRLEEEHGQCGLLISSGPQKSGLATVLDRAE